MLQIETFRGALFGCNVVISLQIHLQVDRVDLIHADLFVSARFMIYL